MGSASGMCPVCQAQRNEISPAAPAAYAGAVRYIHVAGAHVSVIGVGAWQFGSREWGYGDAYAHGEAARIVQRALDLGVNLIDTAEIYGFGRSERIAGRAIAGRRDEVFVATKLFPVIPLAPIVERRGRSSAHRLGIEMIDLYQVHQPNPDPRDIRQYATKRRGRLYAIRHC